MVVWCVCVCVYVCVFVFSGLFQKACFIFSLKSVVTLSAHSYTMTHSEKKENVHVIFFFTALLTNFTPSFFPPNLKLPIFHA